MKFRVPHVSQIYSSNFTITDLDGASRRCAECNKRFDNGDSVIVLAESLYKDSIGADDVVELSTPDIRIVHLKGKETGSCLEDFIARVVANKEVSRETPPAAPV